jgi:conjugative relaxase-like TrwC/TraI family protein
LTAEEVYQRSLETEPYADAERREQLRLDAAKAERRNIAFMDVTFSVQKSITVLHAAFEAQEVKARRAGDELGAAAWAAHRKAVEDAIWAGNNSAVDYLQEHAGYSRVGHHGGAAGRFIDAHEWTVASFFQHTSRTNDPQLHIHNALAWRSEGADGRWRTLDSRSLYLHRPAAGAMADRTTVEHLARGLRVSAVMRPDGKSRELIGVPERVNDLFSSRTRTMGPKVAELARVFEQRYGRQPNALERDRLQQQAALITRPRKSHEGETLEERLDRWERQLQAEVSVSLEQVAADVLALAEEDAPTAQRFDADAVLETAIAEVQASKAAWTKPDLMRAIDNALPDYLGGHDGATVQQLLSTLADEAIARHGVPLTSKVAGDASLPAELRLADGSSAYDRPGGDLYATDAHLRSERALRAATRDRSAARLTPELAATYLNGLAETGVELGADQATAVRGILTSGATVESLIGPAGTGKSFVVGVINHAWTDPAHWPDGRARKVIGLATSQIATNVLAEEGLTARNITRWLAIQQRLNDGSTSPGDLPWRLSNGDLVVVDESAMADTAALALINAHVDRAGAKVLLTGDHRQLAAVGAAGGMQLAAENGRAYELTEARRFTHGWERAASLSLREGDDRALQIYRKQGCVIDTGTVEQAHASAARAWLADTLAGHESLLIADTNEQADHLCAQLRAELVRLGRVEEHGVPLGRQGTLAGRGDLVQARLNGWDLAGYEGNRRGPINRETYRVLDVREDGGLIVAPILGRTAEGNQLGHRMTLPGSYVSEHVALGYASTAHSAQGRTVDTAHSIATSHTSRAALYTALTRGRHRNTAHTVTLPVAHDDAPTGTANQVQRRDPLAVLSRSDEDERQLADQPALAQAERRQTEAQSLRTLHERFTDACEVATAGRTSALLDQLVDDGVFSPRQRATLAADDGLLSLDRILRQAEIAGHDPRTVLREAAASRDFDHARSLASVLHHRITDTVDLHPASDNYAGWMPAVHNPAWQRHLRELGDAADARRDQLGHQVATEGPAWAVAAFGPVPDDRDERDAWAERAAAVAAHRELTGHEDPEVALPGPPKRGQVEAYASWRAGWRALGRDEAAREEAELSDGQLRVRVRAYEREKAWEPDYVAPDLAATIQAAQRPRDIATVREAEALDLTPPSGRDVPGQRKEPRLGGAVADPLRVAVEDEPGDGVDDGAATPLQQRGDPVPAHEEGPGEVDGQGSMPHIQGHVHHVGVTAEVGLGDVGSDVEEPVDAPVLARPCGDELGAAGLVGDVELHRDRPAAALHDAGRRDTGSVGVEVSDDNRRALFCQTQSGGRPDARPATGDNRHLVSQSTHGGPPLVSVSGEQLGEELLFRFQPLQQRQPLRIEQRALGGRECRPGAVRDRSGPADRLRQRVGSVDHLVEETEFPRPSRVDRLRGQDHPGGPGGPDESREALRGAGARHGSHRDLVAGEVGARGAEPEGAGQGELAAAAPGLPVDDRDGRLGDVLEVQQRCPPAVQGVADGFPATHPGDLLPVGVRHEVVGAVAGQQHDGHRVVRSEAVEVTVESTEVRQPHLVVRRPVEGQDGDGALLGE